MSEQNTILFDNIELPKCPFIWNYENQYIHPIINVMELPIDLDINENINKIIDNIEDVQDVDKIKKFKKDYFVIEQKILLNKSEKNKINLSFHSWYFSKISKNNDMTKVEFNIPVNTCIVSQSNNIISDEIILNKFTKRKINIHNKRLSPANSNTFFIDYDYNNDIDNKQIKFYSVCFDTKIKCCVITCHILYVE